MAPLAAELLSAFTDDRRHQKLFDEFTGSSADSSTTRRRWRRCASKIREELPSLFNLFRADAYLLKKIVASAGSLLDEVRADPDHPMRQEFDRFVERLHRSAAQFQANMPGAPRS